MVICLDSFPIGFRPVGNMARTMYNYVYMDAYGLFRGLFPIGRAGRADSPVFMA